MGKIVKMIQVFIENLPDGIGSNEEDVNNNHGKSTLADRLLEITGTKVSRPQVLDKLEVERRRGITVRAQNLSLHYKNYLLNLIDTPGHVDFSYEVSRSLRACEGAILLIDATAGIQAQTFSTFYQAMDADLEIIPVLNKIDHQHAIIEQVENQLKTHFGIEETHKISAATGQGVEPLLEILLKDIPPPANNVNLPFRALLFDSWYDPIRGTVCLFKIADGSVSRGDTVKSIQTGNKYTISEIGIMKLTFEPCDTLYTGQVGYAILNMKETAEALIGDTFSLPGEESVKAFSGFRQPKCMVFAGVFPEEPEDYDIMEKSIQKLNLEDRSLQVEKDFSNALGNGFRCGFLGLLHMDIIQERLASEYSLSVIMTSPSVQYKVATKTDPEIYLNNANDLPMKHYIRSFQEPMVEATTIIPLKCISIVMKLFLDKRGTQLENTAIDASSVMLRYKLPLSEVITDFFDSLKSITKGMGTLDYEYSGYEDSDLGKLTVLLNGENIEALSIIVHKLRALERGSAICHRLKEILPRQMFDVAIQASYNNKVIARQTLKAYRKDVTAKLYGGDQTRKDKLLQKQKKGKKRMKMLGSVPVNSSTYQKILKFT